MYGCFILEEFAMSSFLNRLEMISWQLMLVANCNHNIILKYVGIFKVIGKVVDR